MRRNLLAILLLGCFVSTALGDALLLKDGRKVIGRVTDKKEHYEISVDGQTLTFDKDDVEKWIKSPKEITGDVDKLIEDAKRIYSEAVEIKDDKAADAKFREALPKVTKAREALAEARDLFPDGHTELDTQLVNVMKLMRLVRERVGSQMASGAPPLKAADAPLPRVTPKAEVKPVEPEPKFEPPPAAFGLADALAILADPARRADGTQRGQARAFLRQTAEGKSAVRDLAAAGSALLSRPDAEWRLAPDGLQPFFKAAAPDKLEALSEKEVGEAVKAIAAKVKELRAKGPDPSIEALMLLASGAASSLIAKNGAKPTAEVEGAFKDLGFEKSEFGSVWGRKDGLAMDDYRKWVAAGEFALAVVQFQKDYAHLPELGPRYAMCLLMVFKAIQDNRGYTRAASQFEVQSRTAPSAVSRDHLQALSKSIREESPCAACGGTHKINCSICKGKGKFNGQCGKCGGSGAINTFRGVAKCVVCNGAGGFKNVKCVKCKESGKVDCKARDCDREVKPPTFESFASAFACQTCRGKPLLRHVALPCTDCIGIGLLLQPKLDPAKTLK